MRAVRAVTAGALRLGLGLGVGLGLGFESRYYAHSDLCRESDVPHLDPVFLELDLAHAYGERAQLDGADDKGLARGERLKKVRSHE